MKQNMKKAIGLSLKRYNETYMKETHNRIDNIVAQSGTDNTEIVDARIDSAGVTHTTLNNRIIAETKMNDQHLVSCSGEYITAENTMGGSITNLEILGNTIQNEEDLADIKSVGELQEDGTYKMSILSCGKNLASTNNIFVDGNIDAVGVVGSYPQDACNVTDFIKVKPNTNYIRNIVSDFKNTTGFYDANKNFISRVFSQQFTTPSNCMYVRVKYDKTKDLQLEEGTVATPYEPYQENKCDILLPCQLEKVGDVSDRLYYDDVEKAWCVEKNVGTDMLETYDWQINRSHTNCIAYQTTTQVPNMAASRLGICLGFITNFSWEDSKHYHNGVYEDVTRHIITIPRTEAETPTALKQYLSSNNIYAKYQLATPQKIVLPLSTQIALNSFFGTTHIYMESGEVEGTIKCKIPKSLGATVQSLNNKTDILSDRIEAIEGLKDSQNMKYETDKGYLVCKETKNGVIDDLKIEGKTLVNLVNELSRHWVNSAKTGGIIDLVTTQNLNPNKYYTLYAFGNSFNGQLKNSQEGTPISVLHAGNTPVLFKGIEDCNLKYYVTGASELTVEYLTNIKIIILEGDHTQNPPSYFEGLMSVGQDVDKIEVLSRGGTLWDGTYEFGGIWTDTGLDSDNLQVKRSFYIPVKEGTDYFVKISDYLTSEDAINIHAYDKNKNPIKWKVSNEKYNLYITNSNINKFTTPNDCKFIKFRTEPNRNLNNNSVIISFSEKIIGNELYKQDKKQILFYNENGELEPIQELHEWDSIEKHSDNKWYYHKRSGKVVLNGSESWTFSPGHSDITTSLFYYRIDDRTPNSECICDKFTRINGHTVDYPEGVCYGADINIRISTSKLSTQDVQGFKQWLQANPVTVVYQLAQEEVYELAPLHLDSYANETLILCNSGAISPKMEFSITSHINELVKAYGERINLLEEKVYQYMVTQNRMQLASTYSADSVTFKVDYFSLCGDEENYDEDLYNLILNNILVGKDNYNYDKMFTMILDYASWNQISWEQFDILVGLMDMQHNPPVEEEITEDESIEETPVE